MTTPAPPSSLPAPPALPSAGFAGTLSPVDVQQRIINLLLDQAPFTSSLTRLTTRSGRVAFPVAAPTGQAWVPELGQIPLMDLGDAAYVVAVAKLAGLVDVSNEMLLDQVPVTALVTTLLQDSLSRDCDLGLLFGGGPPEPEGVVASAEEITGSDLLAAAHIARGSISDRGGMPNTIAVSGAMLAAADNMRDLNGMPIFPAGFGTACGLDVVVVPELPNALVYDSTRLFAVINGDLSSVEMSGDFRFDYDATTFRVKLRVACACPDPARTIRRLNIGGASAPVPAAQSAAAPSAARNTGSRKH